MSALRELTEDNEPATILGRYHHLGLLVYRATESDKAWTLNPDSLRWASPWRPDNASAPP
jgi:hypothetical protein